MTPHRKIDTWIALNVTKTLRRLTDDEYAALKAECDEINAQPHPNLELTQPYRYDGHCPRYSTERGTALELLEFVTQHLDRLTARTDFQIVVHYDEGSLTPWTVVTDSTKDEDDETHRSNCAAEHSLPLAIAVFSVNLCGGDIRELEGKP